MLLRRVITRANRHSTVSGQLKTTSFNTTASPSNTSGSDEPPPRAVRELKEWRKLPEREESVMKVFEAPTPKHKKLVLPRTYLKLAPIEFKKWWKGHKVNYLKFNQRFTIQRHEILGCELAAAHFLVHRNGRVKFYGQTDWVFKDKNGMYDLPKFFHASWQLTHIDATGVPLYYEGLENFQNLKRVGWANFSKNPNLNDWCLDKISAHFPNIEYLDVSECENVTERGLEALYRSYSLKTLIITDWHKTPSFELTCAMLEDCSPGLTIEIKAPVENSKKKEKSANGL